MEGRPQLRPLAIGEIVDTAVSVYRAHAAALVRIVVPIVVPLQVLAFFVGIATINDPEQLFGGFDSGGSSRAAETIGVSEVVGNLAISLLGTIAVLLTIAACFRAISDAYLGREPDPPESLRFAVGRLPSLLWIMLLSGVLLFFAFLALIIPGIWLAVAWSMTIPVLLVEGIRGRKALGRSYRLVRGRWWSVLAALGIGFVLAAIVQFILGLVIGLVLVVGSTDSVVLAVLLNSVISAVASIITTPFLAAIYAIVYYDLRVRREGFDLELMAAGVGGPQAGAVGPGQAPLAPVARPAPPPPPPPPPPPE